MAETRYIRKADFTSFEQANPTAPKRGTDLDAEFDAIKNTTDETQDHLGKIQRDDLKLGNLTVHPDALANAVRALILIQGADIRGSWKPDTDYVVGDVIQNPNGAAFICFAAHTSSGNFSADQPTHWLVIAEATNVVPKLWQFVGDGVTKEFYLPGADISDPRLYEVVVGGTIQVPPDPDAVTPGDNPGDYDIVIGADLNASKVVFTQAPGDGVKGFAVLRGYPQTTPIDLVNTLVNSQTFQDFLKQLITNTVYESTNVLELGALSFLLPLLTPDGGAFQMDGRHASYLLRSVSATPFEITVRANDGTADLDWSENSNTAAFWSVVQRGDGQVSVVGADGVTITAPDGYLPKTRAKGSVITLTCDYAAGGQWFCAGDMALA